MFDASRKQNQSMKDLNSTVEQLSVFVNEIAQSATTLANFVAETKDDGNNMNNRMKETVSISQKGKEIMQGVGTAMQSIDGSVRQGVVASEIGKLAQTSMESVKHIDTLVMEIQFLIGDVIQQANGSVENINNSSALIGNAVTTYDTIFENIIVVGDLVQQMIHKVDKVEDVARNVAAISEEQAASSQEILGSSDILVKQADSLMSNSEAVARESEELTTSAQELETQIKIFRVD